MRKRLKPQLNIEIERALFEALERACTEAFLSKAAFVRQAIAEKIEREGMEKGKRKKEMGLVAGNWGKS